MKTKRDIFGEIMLGVESMKQQREGKITLKKYKLPESDPPEISSDLSRKTRGN